MTTPAVATLAALLAGAGCDRPETVVEADEAPAESLEEVDLAPEPVAIEVQPAIPIIDKGSKVTILGYHQFITAGSPGEMRIMVNKFKEQMFSLKEAGIPVVSLGDYMAWRRGEKQLPERCVVITIDDGYDDIHSYALPVFRELGYPFTFYIYTNFLGGGGRTLDGDQVRELIAAGGELGSHSISHDFLVRAKSRLGDRYEEWLEKELKGSKETLEQRFGVEVTSFAYPYGEYNDELAAKALEWGYESAVTVNGAKAGFESKLMELPRYIIHGNNDINWNSGTNFSGGGGLAGGNNLLRPKAAGGGEQQSPIRVWPDDGAVIADRRPLIWADLSQLEGLDPASLEMKVSGFGKVPAAFNAETKVISWPVPRNLRTGECHVALSLRRSGKNSRDDARWTFRIDRTAYYLPDYRDRLSAQGRALSPAGGQAAEGAGDGG